MALLVEGLFLLGLLLAVGWPYLPFTRTYFATTDFWPLLESSITHRPLDWLGLFAKPIMAGTAFTQDVASHYRPLVSVSFAFDYAIGGLEPYAYHATNLALHVGTVAGMYALARTLHFGVIPSGLGAALFGLHPAVMATVPALSRRQDVMAAFFLFPSLIGMVHVCTGVPRSRRWGIAAAALFACAVLSKEAVLATGPAIGLLAILAAYLGPREGAIMRAMKGLAWIVLATVLSLAARFIVVGGLGGYSEPDSYLGRLDAPPAWRWVLERMAFGILWQWPPDVLPLDIQWLVVAMATFAGLFLFVAGARREGATVFVLLAWLTGFWALYTSVGNYGGNWYIYICLAGLGLAFAAAVNGVARLISTKAPRPFFAIRSAGLAVLAVLLTIAFIGPVSNSPYMRRYPDWINAGALTRAYVTELTDCAAALPPGTTTLTLENIRGNASAPTRRSDLVSPTTLDYWSLRSLARLVVPQIERAGIELISSGESPDNGPEANLRTRCYQPRGKTDWHLRFADPDPQKYPMM